MKLETMLGYKLFKELEDGSIDLIRITKIKKRANGEVKELLVHNIGTDEYKTYKTNNLDKISEYTPLEPDGVCTFSIITIGNEKQGFSKDVLVTAAKFLNIKIGDALPYAVCRQSITDIFYNLLCTSENDMMVGLAVNQDDCPTNFDFRFMMACSGVEYMTMVNFYRSDTLEDILKLVNTLKFDNVLDSLFIEHAANNSKYPEVMMKSKHKGWVRSLKALLYDNNFQEDINQMLGITDINPKIEEHTVTKTLANNEEYTSLDEDMIQWLSYIYKLNISNATVLEYNHDINLGEFNNARYFLLRDPSKKLYLIVYTLDGEYHATDLEAQLEKKDFSEEFRINFYNKYNNIK